MVEYRMADGRRISVVEDRSGKVRLVNSENEKINLRSLGCPDDLASRVEKAREARQAAAPVELASAIRILRAAAKSAARGHIAAVDYRNGDPLDSLDYFDVLGGHLRLANEFAEAAFAMSDLAKAVIGSYKDEDDGAFEDDSFRAMKESHERAHMALNVASAHCAETQSHHQRAHEAALARARLTSAKILD